MRHPNLRHAFVVRSFLLCRNLQMWPAAPKGRRATFFLGGKLELLLSVFASRPFQGGCSSDQMCLLGFCEKFEMVAVPPFGGAAICPFGQTRSLTRIWVKKGYSMKLMLFLKKKIECAAPSGRTFPHCPFGQIRFVRWSAVLT